MASVLQRVVRGLAAHRFRPATFARAYASQGIPDIMDHATGKEKFELDQIAKGNLDPFDMEALRRGPGTKEEPNIVKSTESMRMIGCICDEEQTVINYMWLHKDEMKRCGCGYWFKLVDAKPPA